MSDEAKPAAEQVSSPAAQPVRTPVLGPTLHRRTANQAHAVVNRRARTVHGRRR